ncbi:MAG: hypothetical protein P4K83_02795 [Terracidiphilus sp.]|nr:hypothetical protein [Terracidiphilus sp.]
MSLLIHAAIPERKHFASNALAAFREACLASIDLDLSHAIFYRLLAEHANHLLDAYHQVPLEVAVTDRDFKEFKELIAMAEEAVDQSAERQLAAANAMARASFF